MRPVVLALLLSAMASLSACGVASREYVLSTAGFSSTPGKVEALEGLNTSKTEYLKDGVVLQLTAGGKARLKNGESSQTLDLPAGSRVVLCEDGDYVLTPIRGAGSASQ